MNKWLKYHLIFIFVIFVIQTDTAIAGDDVATFEAFYKNSLSIGPFGWTMAILSGLIAGALIIFSGGAAIPAVLPMASFVGGTLGLSGVAATNAGLALLGGSLIGVASVTATAAAAFTFSTEVVLEYSATWALNEYDYRKLVDSSKKLPTLPIPLNDSGSKAYKLAIEKLENIDKNKPLFDEDNLLVVRQAIDVLKNSPDEPKKEKRAKNEILLAILYFISNDYMLSRDHAIKAIYLANTLNEKKTLPEYIYAVTELYEKKPYINAALASLRYSVTGEPDNPLVPLMFSIYLDRYVVVFNDNFNAGDHFEKVFYIMQQGSLADNYLTNYIILLSRYFIRLKTEQQRISSLTQSNIAAIRNSHKTLQFVQSSFTEYNKLLEGGERVIHELLAMKNDFDEEQRSQLIEFNKLLLSYYKDRERLSKLIDELRAYQKPT